MALTVSNHIWARESPSSTMTFADEGTPKVHCSTGREASYVVVPLHPVASLLPYSWRWASSCRDGWAVEPSRVIPRPARTASRTWAEVANSDQRTGPDGRLEGTGESPVVTPDGEPTAEPETSNT